MKFRLSYRSGVCLFLLLFLGLWCTVPAGAEELDRSFGDQGLITTAVGHVGDQAHALVVQPDGKIVVGGSSSNSADLDFAVIRYNPDGTLDPSFNSDGMVTTAVGRGDDEISALAVQDDGRILAAGYSVNGTARDFALVRYNVDGSLDPDFGREGMVVTPVGNGDDEITSMAVDRQGRIIVAGYTTGTLGRAVAVGRYLADGSPDLSFGDQGITLTGIGKDALARSMVLDPEHGPGPGGQDRCGRLLSRRFRPGGGRAPALSEFWRAGYDIRYGGGGGVGRRAARRRFRCPVAG